MPIPPQASPSVTVIKAKDSFQKRNKSRNDLDFFLGNKRNKALELRLWTPSPFYLLPPPLPSSACIGDCVFINFLNKLTIYKEITINASPQGANRMLFFGCVWLVVFSSETPHPDQCITREVPRAHFYKARFILLKRPSLTLTVGLSNFIYITMSFLKWNGGDSDSIFW